VNWSGLPRGSDHSSAPTYQTVSELAFLFSKVISPGNGELLLGGMIQDIGLQEGEVHPILEDTKGDLWLDVRSSEDSANTSEIAKFDGKNFRYFPDEGDLPENLMAKSIEDSMGNIWFSTVSD